MKAVRFFGWTGTIAVLVAALLPAGAVRADAVEEKAQVCAACHGENGVPQEKRHR